MVCYVDLGTRKTSFVSRTSAYLTKKAELLRPCVTRCVGLIRISFTLLHGGDSERTVEGSENEYKIIPKD